MRMLPRQQKVVPNGYQVCQLKLVGTTPLLMSSGDVDRDSDTYLAFESLAKKRGKTQEDKARLREIEWYTRIYYDDDLGPFIPGKNVKELLRSAATAWKLGERVKRSLVIPDYRIPLIYDGPREAAALWKAGFRYTTMVRNSGVGSGSTDRTRPKFEEWELDFEVAFDTSELSLAQLVDIVERSEKYGLGDYRPEFGSFQATVTFLREQRADANADARKPRNRTAESANGKHAAKITA